MSQGTEARIAELQAELESLRARLDALTAAGATARTTLRVHRRCPLCDTRSVLRIERVADRIGGTVRPLAPLVEVSPWTGPDEGLGQFVIYVCRQCGLTEWYVANVDEIPADADGVQLLEGPPRGEGGAGPFR